MTPGYCGEQLELFPTVQQRRSHRREAYAVYAAVLRLRKRGYRVRRCGSGMHLVDGDRLNRLRLLALARRAGSS